MIEATCNVCGKEFAVDIEGMNSTAKHVPLPGAVPLRVRHHEGGNHVDVFGRLNAFYEKIEGRLVKAKPVLSDVLED